MEGLSKAFSLSQLIEMAAGELRKAHEAAPKEAVMQFTGCEIELSVMAGAEAGGGIKLYIFDANAKAKGEVESKIKLSFGPLPGQTTAFQGSVGTKGEAVTPLDQSSSKT